MTRLPPILLAMLLPASALAGSSVGVGIAVSVDLPDSASLSEDGKRYTRFSPGPSLQVPVRIELAPAARLRLAARFDFSSGSDRITWSEGGVRFFDDEGHSAYLAAGALTAGAELAVPGDLPVTPYFGASAGVAWVGTFHSFHEDPIVDILDLEDDDLSDSGSIDPYTAQPCFIADVDLGFERELNEGLALWVEAGYSVAFVDTRPLAKTIPQYEATRSAFGWNAVRVGLGMAFRI